MSPRRERIRLRVTARKWVIGVAISTGEISGDVVLANSVDDRTPNREMYTVRVFDDHGS
jgi:hypothetical protein